MEDRRRGISPEVYNRKCEVSLESEWAAYAQGKGSHADLSRQFEKTSFSIASHCCFELCKVPRRSHTVLSHYAEAHCTHLRISFDLENTFNLNSKGLEQISRVMVGDLAAWPH